MATATPNAHHRTIGDLGKLREAGIGINAHERILMLELLEAEGPINMSAAAESAGVSKAAMTAMADRLELDGTILRTPSATDRRVTTLTLTEKARELVIEATA